MLERDYKYLLNLPAPNCNFDDLSWRGFLDNVDIGDYIETKGGLHYGDIVGYICDKYGFPACFKVQAGDTIDLVSPQDVYIWEPYDYIFGYPSFEQYELPDENEIADEDPDD